MYKIDLKELLNESDVEQKIVYPLLTKANPEGLAYESFNLQTKFNLKRLSIEKRANSKLYYPDYLLFDSGIPVIVVEVKKPGDDLVEAYREARLYALEINSYYKENINPCEFILATDGLKLYAGNWDNLDPKYDIKIENWVTGHEGFTNFIEEFSSNGIKAKVDFVRKKIRTKRAFKRPLNLIGGKHIQDTQTKNSFGETISLQYRHIFNPTNEAERIDVVKNSYVRVPKHLSHVTPIDKLIRRKVRPSFMESSEIVNNQTPIEILNKLRDAQNYNNELILLIGSVGSGKSTFTTYLSSIALEGSLLDKLVWLKLDLNTAPVSKGEIYFWLKKSICEQFIIKNSEIDIHSIPVIKEIFKEEIDIFDKKALALFEPESDNYKVRLFDEIERLTKDIDLKLSAYIDFFVHRNGKNLIIVLDNCDKRNLEEQLLMFDVASWLKENTKSIVFLPLRETTFDTHRHQKPLDTVVKDLTFRINPPSLEKVLYARIKYAVRLGKEFENQKFYTLENGIKVSYPSADELYYLRSILKSLFQNNFFKRLIIGLTGRDVRKGIEIFLDFCKSGHITDGLMFQMKQSKGEFQLPNHLVSRIFIRGNRMYYNGTDSRVKNLLKSEPSDNFPDPLVRINILKWLNDRVRSKGVTGLNGFFSIREIVKDLTAIGHVESRIISELGLFIKHHLVISESQSDVINDLNELVSIDSSGVTHLNLLQNADYLSACSEDAWYNDVEVANRIADRISGKGRYKHLSLQTTINNSMELVNYIKIYIDNFFTPQRNILDDDFASNGFEWKIIEESMLNFMTSVKIEESKLLKDGNRCDATIVNIQRNGIICEIEGVDDSGFIHENNIKGDLSEYDVGQRIKIIIIRYNSFHNKYDLRMN